MQFHLLINPHAFVGGILSACECVYVCVCISASSLEAKTRTSTINYKMIANLSILAYSHRLRV